MLRFTDDNEILREDSYRGIVAGVQWRGDIERSMDELEGLCEADGIQVVGRLEQSLERPNSGIPLSQNGAESLECTPMCVLAEYPTSLQYCST